MSSCKAIQETPSGWRWLARTGLLALSALTVAGVTWGIWHYEAQRRIEASIAAIRAKGQRLLWSEFTISRPIPNADNAAWYVAQAESSVVGGAPTYPIPAGAARAPWLAGVRNSAAANSRALALLRKARAAGEVQWITARDAMGHPMLPQYLNASALAKLAAAKAVVHHFDGDDAEALECWRDVDAVSRIIGGNNCMLISSLISLIVEGIACDALAEIAPAIRIGPEGVAPSELRQVIAELEDDSEFRATVARGFFDERTNYTNNYLMGLWGSSWRPLRPMLEMHLEEAWELMGTLAEDVRDLKRTSYSKPLSETDRLVGVVPQFANVSGEVIGAVLRRRTMAAALAIQLFRYERGRFPATFDELVPAYLSHVPRDPRNEDSTPLGYLLLDGVRPLVYSAGTAGALAASPGPMPQGWPAPSLVLRSTQPTGVLSFDAASPPQAGHSQTREAEHPGKQDQPDKALQKKE